MKIAAFIRVLIKRKVHRYSRKGSDRDIHGRYMYTIQLAGWHGELRKRMTDKEAAELCSRYNGRAFKEAEAAAAQGYNGVSAFKEGHKELSMGAMLAMNALR